MWDQTKTRLVGKLKQHLHLYLHLLEWGLLGRATLDEGPRSRDQWIQAILLVESFKLVPKAFRRGSKTKKWQIEAKRTWHKLVPRKLDPGPSSKVGLSGHLGCFLHKAFFSFPFLKLFYFIYLFRWWCVGPMSQRLKWSMKKWIMSQNQ